MTEGEKPQRCLSLDAQEIQDEDDRNLIRNEKMRDDDPAEREEKVEDQGEISDEEK